VSGESPESRLIGAGYSACGLGWLTPDALRIVTLEQALAMLPDPQPEPVWQEPGPQESAESRAIGAGYARSPLGWLAPGGHRVVSLEEAIAEIEGEGPT
jgi:hypothetical protein